MRILILSDPIWLHPPSAYSKISDKICQLLNQDGHTVGHVPIREGIRGVSMLEGHAMTWKGTLLLEGGGPGDAMSENAALRHYYDFKADFLLSFKDIYNFRFLLDYPINWCPITPIDHTPVSREVTVRLKTTFQVVTITRFGKRELNKAGIPSTYIPLFVDTNLYKPLNKAEAKQVFGLPPDCFGILIMAMNRRRKMIPRMFRACKRFLENNPDAEKNTKIIAWTDMLPEFFTEDGARGTMLRTVANRLGLQNVIFTPTRKLYSTGLEEYRMPLIYNAGDCVLCGSNEGFWMPGIEAGACGVPAVVVESAAAPEVTTGELAKVADWDVMNPVGYNQPLVDIDDMAKGIEKIYNGDPKRYMREARRYAMKYDVNSVYEKYWKPFLERIEPMLRPLVTKGGIESWQIA